MVNVIKRLALGGGVLALALTTWAADLTYKDVTLLNVHNWSGMPVEEVQEILEDVKDSVQESTVPEYKLNYALAVACLYARSGDVRYAQAAAKFDETVKELNIPADYLAKNENWLKVRKLILAHRWWNLSATNEDRDAALKECPKEAGLLYVRSYAQMLAGRDGVEAVMGPEFMKDWGWREEVINRLISEQKLDKASDLFFNLLLKGQIGVATGNRVFQTILAYEITKDGYDPQALKAKLEKAVMIYKVKIRQFKPAKEGDVNPYLSFVGMIQDAANDLK